MSNSITPFDYHGKQVRLTGTKEKPLWILADVCKVLDISHVKDTADRLDKDEVGQTEVIDSIGRKQKVWVVTESGLYAVILRSDKPEAKPFRKWVTAEVLPSIRKTGSYSVNQKSGTPKLGEVNAAARIINQTLKEAGMPPQYRAVAIKSLYAPVGVEIPLDGVKTDKQLFDCTAIANKLDIRSAAGKPHNQAVAAIIAKLDILDNEKELVPYQRQSNGHAGPTWQYAQSVLDKVRQWVLDNDYPLTISANGKSYKVTYRKVA